MTLRLLGKAARKLARPFWRSLAFDIAERSLEDFREPPARPGLACRLYPCGQAEPALAALAGFPLPVYFEARLASGDLALVSDGAGGAPLGYAWGSVHPQPVEGVPPFLFAVRPRPGQAYLYDFYVLPEKRRRGVLDAAVPALLAHYRDLGLRSAFLLFNAADPAMRAFTRKAGFRIAGRVAYRRFLWRVVTNLDDLARLTGRSLDGRPAPTRPRSVPSSAKS